MFLVLQDLSNCGEIAWFWEDLSSNSNLIAGGFNVATGTPPTTGSGRPAQLMPAGKLGANTFIYVYANNNLNYYGFSAVTVIDGNGGVYSNTSLSVAQAFNVDKKVDDGFPQSGRVTAQYSNCCPTGGPIVQWADPAGAITGFPYTTATAGSSATCYDNNNTAGANQYYSMDQNNGAGLNCALSFKFQ